MNSKIEETLNLPNIKDIFNEHDQKSTKEITKMVKDKKSDYEKAFDWESMDEHDEMMDQISEYALKSYEDLIDLGKNIESRYCSQAFEPAVNMLKTALDANNSKNDKKLRLMRLQLEKQKLDHKIKQDTEDDDFEDAGEGQDVSDKIQNRNELMKFLKSQN